MDTDRKLPSLPVFTGTNPTLGTPGNISMPWELPNSLSLPDHRTGSWNPGHGIVIFTYTQ